MEIKLSVIILAKNEEDNIVDCLESVSFADEILVIDDFSKDRTIEIIESLRNRKIKLVKNTLGSDFSSQRNFGLSKAQGDWALFIDADERVSEALTLEISNIKYQISNKYNGFYIKRRDFMWGRELKHGEVRGIKLLRLAEKGKGEWEGKVHEKWKIKGPIDELRNPLLHYPHQTISEFLREINFYTDIRAKELYMKGIHVYLSSIILYPAGKFLLNYIFKRGFLDGIPGLILAILMSFHSFLVRGKVWLLNRRNE